MTILLASLFHINLLLPQLMASFGHWIYIGLFGLIFIETGLVVFPFLPGDSMLFLSGSLAAMSGSGLNIGLLVVMLILAAILGDGCNFELGKRYGHRLLNNRLLKRLFKPSRLQMTEQFFEKHGPAAIFLGRFVPVVRTLVPFTAGMTGMRYRSFAIFNCLGAVSWILVTLGTGYLFGNISIVQQHFELMMMSVVLISLIPMALKLLKARRV
ncbi:VTT domain-containing protein [Lactiplantibacillus pingfangensis]|uniref:VTT domain-containing protein n=1 Tax=Lactiplantibacillus pingfangensis TaxID=2559915 RepID=UPI0010F74E96|nr:VTT domain-containing protein [Lactiplantibacillus pingfangensis]